MPRKVFFSFHYDNDIRRVVQVRNAWIIRPEWELQPFSDKAEWETIKRGGKAAITNWIDNQLKGTSVTIVLIGANTFDRKWVRYEIRRSYELKKGMLGIYIHNIRDPIRGRGRQGKNPFDRCYTEKNDQCYSKIYKTYDWKNDNGYEKIASWIETAFNQPKNY